MQRDSDEDAWRAIVDNYGDRAALDGESPTELPDEPPDEPPTDLPDEPRQQQRLERLFRPLPQPEPAAQADLEDRFVPPTPPPLPRQPPDRMLAWSGLFGAPTVLLVCLVLGIRLAPILAYLLVASFIGGFGYLVVKMPRGRDIDPWDDGARL